MICSWYPLTLRYSSPSALLTNFILPTIRMRLLQMVRSCLRSNYPGKPWLFDLPCRLISDGNCISRRSLSRLGLQGSPRHQRYSLRHAMESNWVCCRSDLAIRGPEISSPRSPFTRKDWDEAWGHEYEVITEMVAPSAKQPIEIYPKAKVVIVQRDFEKWWPSFVSELLEPLFSPLGIFATFLAGHVMGIRWVDHAQSAFRLLQRPWQGRHRKQRPRSLRWIVFPLRVYS